MRLGKFLFLSNLCQFAWAGALIINPTYGRGFRLFSLNM